MRHLSGSLISYIILIVVSLIAVYTDYRFGKIYNWLNFSVIVIGIIISITQHSLLSSMMGILLGFFIMFPFFTSGGMGAGDVKFAMATGALVGARMLLLSFAVAGVLIIVYAIIRRLGVIKIVISGFKDLSKMIKIGFRRVMVGLKLSAISGKVYFPGVLKTGKDKDGVKNRLHWVRYGVFLGFSNILISLYLIIEQGGIK